MLILMALNDSPLWLVQSNQGGIMNDIGGEIASTFDHPELVKLGHCDVIEEIIIGEDKVSNIPYPYL